MAQNENTPVNQGKSGIIGFLSGVKSELKKVVWPTRRELVSYTGVVFVAVAFVCALIWICDTVFARIFDLILR
ncbi:preprotein translocase subunit SecE [Megamonas funiformis]|jgi:preprotein translocase subunit SecE|uniref:preprotein translocase subunit SecE n=1 Tax=Megamonas funiformis TaxID=437897 RepID=UPI0022E2CA65|nr:preprotein translocase subunit SecE [Megamonas funiformis]